MFVSHGAPRRILIVKFGALGDVVRTAYFAEAIKRDWPDRPEITWVTDSAAVDVLRFNPHIDRIVVGFDGLRDSAFDVVYSLDDELDIVTKVSELGSGGLLHGAYMDDGQIRYTDSAARWFDMGLISRLGRPDADRLKRANQLSHGEIFSKIFSVTRPRPRFFNSSRVESHAAAHLMATDAVPIGMSVFAGRRWPAKSMPPDEAVALIRMISMRTLHGSPIRVFLLGTGAEQQKNEQLFGQLDAKTRASVAVLDTSWSILDLAAHIRQLAVLVTADSLPMHLGIAQRVPTVAFFTVTSASEIDSCPKLTKVISTASDYCSYRPNGDNSTITAQRICDAIDWSMLDRRTQGAAIIGSDHCSSSPKNRIQRPDDPSGSPRATA